MRNADPDIRAESVYHPLSLDCYCRNLPFVDSSRVTHLLRDPRTAELVRSKVQQWVAMGTGGWNFQQMGMAEYCQELLDKWSLPFYISPSGKAIKTGHRLLGQLNGTGLIIDKRSGVR